MNLFKREKQSDPVLKHTDSQSSATSVDPVCGMTVRTAGAAFTSTYQGQTYYFCAASCKKSFDANPAKYAGQAHSGHSGGHCCH